MWFVIGLLAVSGAVTQVGWQGMADRFTYLPHIGLAVAVVWGTADLLTKHRRSAAALSAAAVALLAIASWRAPSPFGETAQRYSPTPWQ